MRYRPGLFLFAAFLLALAACAPLKPTASRSTVLRLTAVSELADLRIGQGRVEEAAALLRPHNDRLEIPTTANTATGLAGGTVRSIEWPHTQENYLLKEMGFRIARKHSAKLRRITQVLAFAAPAILLAIGITLPWSFATAASVLAALLQFAGMLVERWLFFAEAKHTVTLYYGR